MNRADILEASAKDVCNKELPTTSVWPTVHHVASPLGHTKGGMEHLYGPRDNAGTLCGVNHCGIMDQLGERRLTRAVFLSVVSVFCLSRQSRRVVLF